MGSQPKAYLDHTFLKSEDARPIRILAEYLEPQRRFKVQNIQDTVVFFGSARIHSREAAQQSLDKLTKTHGVSSNREVSEILARGRRAGGGPGIMEAANRGATEGGGKTIGLNISLPREQGPNPYITDGLHFEFHYFFMRKFWFAYLAKALVIFPGGFGTLDEMFEILTLMQTEKLAKQIQILLYGSEYWDPILSMKPLVEWGAIAEKDVDLLTRADTPETAFELLKVHLTKHHLSPPIVQEKKAPGIAKTRSAAPNT